MKTYECAVVGLGNIGFLLGLDAKRKETWSHVDAYRRCERTVLVAVTDIDAEKREAFAAQGMNIPVYSNIDEMFANHHIDIVSICTPVETHCKVFKCLANRSLRAIFCEKPLAMKASESRSIAALAEEKGLVVAVNHTRRWEWSYLAALEKIVRGDIGRVKAVHSFYPGQIYNIGTHLYDAIRMLTGANPRGVSGIFASPETDDPSISGVILLDDIVCTVLATGRRDDLIFEVDVVGDAGRLRITDNGAGLLFSRFAESNRYSGYRELRTIQIEDIKTNDRFVDAVRDIAEVLDGCRSAARCTASDGYWAVAIAEELLYSARARGEFRYFSSIGTA